MEQDQENRFLLRKVEELLKYQDRNYLTVAPTGVATNISGLTIHSALRIRSSNTRFKPLEYKNLLFEDPEHLIIIQNTKTIIVDEISMVSAELLDYLH